MYDLLISNGHVIDPASNVNGQFDVAVRHGRVAAILEPQSQYEAKQTIDVQGKYVVPGLIDFHVHVFPGVSHFGIDADPSCLARGVTSVLDFGTAGGLIFDGFRQFVIDKVQTRVFALLHIAGQGLISSPGTLPGLGELHDLRYCNVENVERVVNANRDVIVGIKIRCTANLAENGCNEAEGLELARQAADRVGLPLVVHSPDSSLSIEHVLSRMQAGDVLTHCFHGKACGLVDAELKLLPAAKEALDRGVLLDVGHGFGSFDFHVARALLEQGVLPHFISSDIHFYNWHGPVFDLVTTMDKFLHLGMELPEVIRRTTILPAQFLKRETELGTLQVGASADITVLDLQQGEFPLIDAAGRTELGKVRLEPTHVFRSGRPVGLLPRPESQPQSMTI
ncbi:MAG: amidohydrolase/deacetylase family metallohydrolase [Schlesneria sp.]|nr:amidohydrolase/deacetylase family metallohydrolase [Schlesneria sp.]